MEGLSAAGSGIAVASIAVQLAESVKKLSDFWTSIKNAPEDIRAISFDLVLLSSILNEIALDARKDESDTMFKAALEACSVKAQILSTILQEIEPGFASAHLRTRKWTAMKAVLRHGQISKFQEGLDRLKATLLLVQQNHNSRLIRDRNFLVEKSLVAITEGLSGINIRQYSETTMARLGGVATVDSVSVACNEEKLQPFRGEDIPSIECFSPVPFIKRTLRNEASIKDLFLGTIRTESRTSLRMLRDTENWPVSSNEDQSEYETTYTICPAQWMIRLGFRRGFHLKLMSSSTQGWQNSLKTFCPVPDDSLIYEYCREGNLPAVRALLSRGLASVTDTDSRGYTPLHYAAENYHPELCKLLVNATGDKRALTHGHATPMLVAALHKFKNTTSDTASRVFETFRLLADSMDFFDEGGDGWLSFSIISYGAVCGGGEQMAKAALLHSLMKLLSFELKTYRSKRAIALLLRNTMHEEPLVKTIDLLLSLCGKGTIDEGIMESRGFTILHRALFFRWDKKGLSRILDKSPNIHYIGFHPNPRFCSDDESPTSIAMYSIITFLNWLTALEDNGINIEKAIEQEIERNPELHAGWVQDSLLDLCEYARQADDALFPTDDRFGYIPCGDCDQLFDDVRVQPYWRHIMERIKQGLEADVQSDGYSDNSGRESQEVRNVSEHPDSCQEVHATMPPPTPDSHGCAPATTSGRTLKPSRHGYPTNIDIESKCLYAKDDFICMECWMHYVRTGQRRLPREAYIAKVSFQNKKSIIEEESSGDEFSPYHIHS